MGDLSEPFIANEWDQVQDFKWLKPEQSPNWKNLEPSKRVPNHIWKAISSSPPSHTLRDILLIVGILKDG